MQMLKICRRAFEECGTGAYLRTYEIIVTSHNSGLIEFCTETISIDALKRKFKDKRTLR
jgi:phosphatidylinositol 4-kinase